MMSTSLRALLLASALLPANGTVGARAATPAGLQSVRYVCNADGRCFETGELDRRGDDRDYLRRPPRDFDQDPSDFDRGPPAREYDRRGYREDDDDN